MDLVALMKGIYIQLTTDEALLRLLYYAPVNQLDDPLDVNKENILDMEIEQKSEIIDDLIHARDKAFELDLKNRFSRINYYLNNRTPDKKYSSGARKLVNNPFVSRQEVVIDIYTDIEIDKIDFRIYQIMERVNNLLNGKNYKQFIGMKLDSGYTIKNTPDGYIGYRMVYYVLDSQSPRAI